MRKEGVFRRALNLSLITPELIDERVTNLFKIRFRVGQFDPQDSPLDKIANDSTVCTPYALELARDGVAQGTTLLKNDAQTLPWEATKVRKRVFLRRFILKMIILPRQAQDKHREKSKRRRVFL
eukprot:COSAG06_NODE_3071_length_5894_cov_6.093701_2_plen_124_part_00